MALVVVAMAAFGLSFFSQSPPSAKHKPPDESYIELIVVSSSEEAEQILERLKNGEEFGELAMEKSIDPTANAYGFLGKLDPATLRPELRDALQGVSPGQVSRVVRIPEGNAILKVLKVLTTRTTMSGNPASTLAVKATGSVRPTADLSGLIEFEAALGQISKPVGWNLDPRMICEAKQEAIADLIGKLKHALESGTPEPAGRSLSPDSLALHATLAQAEAYQGNMDEAIKECQAVYRIAALSSPGWTPAAEEALGVAYLHKSEVENDVYRAPGTRCLFPMSPGDAYQKTTDSEKAIEYFLEYLGKRPDDLEVKWLLNLAYMTVGKYPAGVPHAFLIPPSAFKSEEDVGRFVDVAPEAGLNEFSMAGGVIVDDFENSGRLDVVTSSMDSCEPLHFFHNNGDGTFTDRAAQAGLSDQLGGLNMVQTDYNNDGCLDILVLRGGWEPLSQRKSLLRNNCDGTFTDVTSASGLAVPATSTQTAVWADINNDGLLDLFVGNENGPAQLFLNKGDGTFEDIAHSAGVDRIAFSKAVAAADYDNDGYVDFYVSNLQGDNFLYHNNHNNTFTEVAQQAGVPGAGRGFAAWFFDYDNDGWPDLFVTSYFTSVDETLRTYLGLPHNAETMKLYKNMGNGTFRDVTAEVGLDKVFMPMGANFGDIFNDGFLDIYLGTGNPSYAALVPKVLLRNEGGKRFVDVTASSGTGELHKGHGIAFADIERDGYEDLFEEVGGAVPGDRHAFRLYQNPGNGNDWINLKIVGVKSNRPAIGARIKVTVENKGQGTRSIYRTVGSGGSFGASPFEQHIGLGPSARILDIEIWWPASNTRQTFTNVDKNQFLEVKEFAHDYTKLSRRPIRLGGAKRDAAALATTPERNSAKSR